MARRLATSIGALAVAVATAGCANRACCARAACVRTAGSALPAPSAPPAATASRPAASPPAPEGEASYEARLKEWERLANPGPQHEFLKELTGTWVGSGTWTEAGETSRFTDEINARLILGGRFLLAEGTMTLAGSEGEAATTSTSASWLGFDNEKQKYVHAAVSDGSTTIDSAEGTYDPATKTLTMSGVEVTGPGRQRRYRLVQRYPTPGEFHWEVHVAETDGTERLAGKGAYRRK
jgi:hypothetical protein